MAESSDDPVGSVRRVPLHEGRDFQGLPLIIEYHAGDRKPDKLDPSTSYLQYADYGYINGTTSNEEGEGIDVFIGDDPNSPLAFLVPFHQDDPETFVEYKVLLGFSSEGDAERFVQKQYNWGGATGPIVQMTLHDLKEWAAYEVPMATKLKDNGYGDPGPDDTPTTYQDPDDTTYAYTDPVQYFYEDGLDSDPGDLAVLPEDQATPDDADEDLAEDVTPDEDDAPVSNRVIGISITLTLPID